MNDEIYRRLAQVLDTLPNGFPSTETGVEIKLLKKIFTPDEAELFCDLTLTFETASEIAERTGRPLEGLEEKLTSMWRERGQIFGIDLGGVKVFKMIPWAVGIYEFQLDRMDREFAELCEEYNQVFAGQFFHTKPQLMRVIPVEEEVPDGKEILPFDRVSAIIEKGESFAVADCICRKERHLLGEGCDKPLEACLAIAPVPGIFDEYHWGRPITREEALNVLRTSEEAGLVHQAFNVEEGQFFICNCCGCCCGVLRAINELEITDGSYSNYYAEIDPEFCTSCGICADERCQVNAIEEGDDTYTVIREKCIGCGLCVSTCPTDAIKLVQKAPEEQIHPPKDEKEWFKERGRIRGVDFSAYEHPTKR
jgi:electron transport complex protein RnfB